MRFHGQFSKILLALVLSLTGVVGCAKEKSGDSPLVLPEPPRGGDGGAPGAPGGTGNGSQSSYSGSTADLVVDMSALKSMFFNSNPQNPTNIKINFNVGRTYINEFGQEKGEDVIISFYDQGVLREAAMGTIHPDRDISHRNNMYNGWYEQDGKQVYKAFFQDYWGAIVVILDGGASQGDGQAPQFLSGAVYFQNFDRSYPNFQKQGPLKMCWEIEIGPYDCRTFLVGDHVMMTSTYYPASGNRGPDRQYGYRKLGTFSGIKASDANLE